MRLTTQFRLASVLALGLTLPALGQDADDGAPEEAAPAAAEAPEEAPVGGEAAVEEEVEAPAPAAEAAPAPPAKKAPKKVKVAPSAAAAAAEASEDAADAPAPAETGSGEQAAAASDASTEAVAGNTGLNNLEGRGAPDAISDGKRLELKGGDISIEPPAGWEIYTKEPGLTFLAMPPKDAKFKYQRTLQVAAFEGARYMDDITAKEFEEEIPRKFQAISNAISDYKVRNHLPVEMGDSRQGLLYYTEFKLNDVPLMQAHIIVSSAANHYLLTYTDVAEHFENEAQSQFLTEAWAAMTSVQLKGRTPMRFTSAIMLGGGLVAFLLLCAIVFIVRNQRAKRAYEMYGSGKGLDDVDIQSDIHSRIMSKQPEDEAEPGTSGMSFMDDDKSKKRK